VTPLLAPVSVGELLDKITILRIKAARIPDEAKLAHVRAELAALEAVAAGVAPAPGLEAAVAALQATNETLWEVEDAIRLCEARGDFGPEFVRLARAVYVTNDRRAQLKREVNRLTGSALVEEKSYAGAAP
jgi:uncharacterized small protein (DUF1192 family)